MLELLISGDSVKHSAMYKSDMIITRSIVKHNVIFPGSVLISNVVKDGQQAQHYIDKCLLKKSYFYRCVSNNFTLWNISKLIELIKEMSVWGMSVGGD